ncbi:hypothetical protein B0H14DRAFT_3085596 [Mycena olivaceomarginata]|nr:hypothetical protein B0H14DRAFT_3085596 [Mycena olivaceomarginata]
MRCGKMLSGGRSAENKQLYLRELVVACANKHLREHFLNELLHIEGQGVHRNQMKCATCAASMGVVVYRCKDCFSDTLFCRTCLVWNEEAFFESLSLKSLGLRIQLGHSRNRRCPGTLAKRVLEGAMPNNARRVRDDFCIIHTNSIHEVGLEFCSCGAAEDHDVQLLRAWLYPATMTNPATAATFAVLRDFHLLSLEAKCSAHHFYNKLACQTNNSGVFQPCMLKQAGRGHATDGIPGTKPGECTLLCPACPQPWKNLPEDGSWRNAPREKCFLFALFLALDAKFRMKRKDVSTEADDPSLGNGIAFFSQVDAYMKHLEDHWDMEQEKSTCIAHDAVDEPDRDAYGTAVSGIGTVDCARHNMKCPNGVGDLQKGERYVNMDYMLWRSLENYDDIIQLFISYDIVCQWHKNIWKRLKAYSPELREHGGKHYYVWLIPKFHLPAHIEACNITYSFNLMPFVGQTDSEALERGWANANPLASSTKEMGPGARRDTLDDHFNDWNHKKIVGLGEFLLERAKKAVENMGVYRLELLEVERGLPLQTLAVWTTAMELWELSDKNPNPFKVTDKHEGIFVIRGQLASEAVMAVARDAADNMRGDLHAHEMIDMGMHLEDQQRELAFNRGAVKLHATDRQKTALLERSNKLGRKLVEWLKIRESFTPAVAALQMEDDEARTRAACLQPTPLLPVHVIKLWLPSKLATSPGMQVKPSHAHYEFKLRIRQAHVALAELRRLLLVRTAKYKYKDEFQHSVAASTRGKTSIANMDKCIQRTAAQYRAARQALVALGPIVDDMTWKHQLRVLGPDDVRQRPRATFSDPQHKARTKRKRGETLAHATAKKRQKKDEEWQASWIWTTLLSDAEGEEAGMAEALRLEWAKMRARAWRWTEEVDLVEEEMRRILAFLQWKEKRWLDLADERHNIDDVLHEGLVAYARHQARIQWDLRVCFEGNWQAISGYIKMAQDNLDTIPAEAAGEEEAEEEEDDEDEEALISEVARDVHLVASFVEESLA